MLTSRQLSDQVEILQRQTTGNPRGDRTYTWPADAAPVPGSLQPMTATEVTTGTGATVTSDWLLILRSGTPVSAYDRVKVNGRSFEVIGEPAEFAHGRLAHLEVRLRAVS